MTRQTKNQWWTLSSLAVVTALAAFIIAGCGGNGSPITVGTQPAGGGAGAGGTQPTSTVPVLATILPDAQKSATRVGSDVCAQCHDSKAHQGRALAPPATTFPDTTHAKKGVGCEDCHGPGSAHVSATADTRKTTILALPAVLNPIVCAQCHSQAGLHPELTQYDSWAVSKHAGIVEDAVSPDSRYGYGCMFCHTDVVRVMDYQLGIPTTPDDRANLQRTASCAVCHDPHAKHPENLMADDGEDHQLWHQTSNVTDYALVGPGTAVSSYTSINQVCAECHNGRGVDPSDTALQKSTSRPSMHHSNQYNMLMGEGGNETGLTVTKRYTSHRDVPDQCAHCHIPNGNHSMTAGTDGCAPCHSATAAASLRVALQTEIAGDVQSLESRLNKWGTSVNLENLGASSWEYSAQGGPKDQTKIPIEIKRARHNYYFVVNDSSIGVHNSAYTRYLIQDANAQLDSLGVAKAEPVRVNLDQFKADQALKRSLESE